MMGMRSGATDILAFWLPHRRIPSSVIVREIGKAAKFSCCSWGHVSYFVMFSAENERDHPVQ